MAHWAELDDNNVVLRVLVGDNDDPNGDEGYKWIMDNIGGRWIKASYNGTIRKRYPGEGFIYDEEQDIFLLPKPHPSWVYNKELDDWEAPVPMPTAIGNWEWDEETQSWQD